MIVPTLATIVVGTIGLVDHIQTSNNADRARTLSKLSTDVGRLVHELQDERAAATILLGMPGGGQQTDAMADSYRKHFGPTDEAQRAYAVRKNGLADLPPAFRSLLRRLDNQLSTLISLREQVAARKDVSLTYTAFFYRVLITDLLAIRDSSAQLAGETSLSDRMRASAAVSSMKEFLSQERIVVLRALSEGSTLRPARQREFIAAVTGQEQALQTFAVVATPEERTLFDQRVSGDDLRLAEKYEGEIESILNGGRIADLHFSAAQWDAAQRERANLLRKVEGDLDAKMEIQATDLRDTVVRQVLVETGGLLAMLLLAILFAWLVARSMARSLRELRHGALSVAQYGLPQAVARLRDPALATQLSPTQVASQIAEPLPVRSKDEFGQVTEAFNAVHMEAVRTAAEQAALRSSVATMFVNLARRSQILVDRLIGHLDRLERGEEDPDRLAELFQLDHLATRMRRNDENLLVLAGADSTRVQREPAALLDVLRAAQSEVEHYTRIEFGVIDRDIEVAAHAVNDLVHLVAELLDNATAFSPPESAVIIEARRVGDRAVLLVEDRGIGISMEQVAELNERLATPPIVDVAVSRMMGLVVVARLASRHGVKVELRPARDRGTVADVTLPTSVLVPRALAGRVTGRDLPPARSPQPAPPQRPTFSAPLALESGPSAAPAGRLSDADRGLLGAGAGPSAGAAPAGSRHLPAWSDLTGAAGTNGADPLVPGPTTGDPGERLPQRRPGDYRTFDGEVTGGPPPLIPRQSTSPESRPNGAMGFDDAVPPVSAPPTSAPPFSAPPFSAPPVSGPPAAYPPMPPGAVPPAYAPPPAFAAPPESPPPVWPPVAPGAEEVAPAVPGELAAALDITSEIPKVRVESEAPAAPPLPSRAAYPTSPPPGQAYSAPPAYPGSAGRTRYADETMELPIFRELESAWFRTRRSATEAGPAGAPPLPDRPAPARQPAGEPRPVPADPEFAHTAAAGPAVPGQAGPWQTVADDGWRAATAAADVQVSETTDAGLPKRVPMAQLVPGGVDKSESTVQRRTPEAVRGLLAAYHRGVQRGRTQQPKSSDPKDRPDGTGRNGQTPEPTTAGPQPSQAGKEQEA
ncbi:MAG TPA: nitrate- and nitrite sensing domain-containing protein [Micromonosporaceae bacterium]|nr:nitrate- and nitrite sensing domain-containing protein [Micromonosporaceae bacterium]